MRPVGTGDASFTIDEAVEPVEGGGAPVDVVEDVDEFDDGGPSLPVADEPAAPDPAGDGAGEEGDAVDVGPIEGLPDDLMSDDWSLPAGDVSKASFRDLPIGFVEAHEPTVVSHVQVARDDRAVAYTRESTEDQTENSQPRQLANIGKYVEANKYRLVGTFSDEGVSGTTLHGRHRFQAMMEAARRGEFKIVAIENLDRFGRSLPDVLEAWEELRDLGVELHDAKQGRLDLAHIVIMGYLGTEGRVRFLDLCKGGKKNAVLNGLVMHAPSYGYRKHPSKRGVHLVVPDRAAVVRLIFKWVAAGVGSKRIADELTARGVPSPRQCQRLDNAEAVDAASLPWDAAEVRNIVRNPIYAGWNVWGRTTPRRDRKTKRVLGHDKRPKEDWVVSRVPALAIVPEEAQAAAMASLKRRSFGGASSANRAGNRLLAGCVRCAACGSPMHVGVNNLRHLVYHCSDHRTSRVDRCAVASTVRLEYVERAVIAEVGARLLPSQARHAYRERFVAAFEEGDAARRRRVAELDRAIAKVKDDLKASFMAMARRTGVPDEEIAEINDGLAVRKEQLQRIRAGLVATTTPAEAFAGMDALERGLKLLASSVPFRPVDPEGEALAQAFRRLVGPIRVHPRDDQGIVRLEMRLDRDRVTRPRSKVEAADAASTTLLVDVKAELRREADGRFADAFAPMLEAARTGSHALTDEAWAIAEPLLRDYDAAYDGEVVETRPLIEGVLLILKTRGALTRPPERYGDADVFHRALLRLVKGGHWDAVVAAWRAHLPSALEGAELERLDTTTYARAKPRRREGKLEKWDRDEKARRSRIVDAAIAAETDPLTLKRLGIVKARLEGAFAAETARRFEEKLTYVYFVYCEYRLSGVEGVKGVKAAGKSRRTPKLKPELFSPRAKEDLRRIHARETGRSGRPPVVRDLVGLCAKELGVDCSFQTMRKAMRELGLTTRGVGSRSSKLALSGGGRSARPGARAPATPTSVMGGVPDASKASPKRRRGAATDAVRLGVAG